MIRLVAIQVALFLLPFAVYALVLKFGRRVASFAEMKDEAPVLWLAAGGLALVAISLLVLAAFDGGSATGLYVPDRFEDGRLVPGHIE